MRQTTAFLPIFLFSATLLAQSRPSSQPSQQQDHILSRVVTCGASLTAGGLHKILDRGIAVPHTTVRHSASIMFFMSPDLTGKTLLRRALKKKPTLLIGLDYLFWYCYGRMGTDGSDREIAARMTRLERGLKEIAKYEGPLVIADLPDMRGADPRMLSQSQIPSVKALEKLNARIREWAAKRDKTTGKVLVIPLAKLLKMLKSGKMAIPASKDGKHAEVVLSQKMAMKWDRLHPTRIGSVALCSEVWRLISEKFGKEAKTGIVFDDWAVLEQLNLTRKLELASSKPAKKK